MYVGVCEILGAQPWMPARQLAAPFQWPIKDNYGSNYENSCVRNPITRMVDDSTCSCSITLYWRVGLAILSSRMLCRSARVLDRRCSPARALDALQTLRQTSRPGTSRLRRHWERSQSIFDRKNIWFSRWNGGVFHSRLFPNGSAWRLLHIAGENETSSLW